MSLFGGASHTESSPIQSESDGAEIQEIPESPEQREEENDNLDDDDDVYSDEVYSDEESDGGDERSLRKSMSEKEKKKYRQWFRDEIRVFEAFETTRAGDLGRNLLGAASERHGLLLKKPASGVVAWASRGRWTDDREARRAVPAPGWTAWPLWPGEVPLPEERFYGVRDGGGDFLGVKRRKVVGPGAEFEEVLCDVAVGKARERVDGELNVENPEDAECEGGSSGSGEEEGSDCDSGPEVKKTRIEDRDSSAGVDSRLVFSVDQDRARKILRPTVRSIMSKVDALATGLYHSRMNHRAHRSASHDRDSKPSRPKSSSSQGEKKEALGLRDWSEVLGMASLTGWDPQIVGRAAERCSKLFGEGMAFATLDADEASTKLHEYKPDIVPDFDDDGEEGWTLDTLLCPHEECARHARGFDLRRRLRWHIKDVHDWDPEVEKRPKEIIGGVHLDGFMREIPAQPGWRARDKVKSEKRVGKRKKEFCPDVEK
ncbi:hypothetical protein E2P81_ATG02050 [Venturia nashicola]|uniref:Rrn9 domain-containing protein n=1 Tax=Venturia nashicola TaxID=86259 RepID=A0A4Z1PD34_9PEZI|nr:hypothetical protein E6O75_ATG02095 [Venturia nashicola]TLD35747.1 hypothetical protein E2P81_ATG02050 [Venturia nashicola]